MSRLKSELVVLFGRKLVDHAKTMDVAVLTVTSGQLRSVAALARDLVAVAGNPEQQRELITGLDDETALLLCLWILDSSIVNKILSN